MLLFSVLLSYAQTPFPNLEPVFVDEVLPRIDIIIPADSLAILFAPGNEDSDYHWHARFIFDNGTIRDTVDDIGFRFRGNTSRNAAKKSYKVSFNTYSPGRRFYGLEKMNLNGENNDPSVIRAKLSWDLLRRLGIPAPRANHIDLYINGEYFGLYIHVEHIDDRFVNKRFGNDNGNLYKCLWPADLTYLGDDPEAYKGMQSGRRTYELQTNKQEDDYADLALFIGVLNNTPIEDLPCELEKVFNVDAYLRVMVYDLFAANWDGPIFNKNNFYLYHNLESGQFEYIPFDLDNTFGIDWFIGNLASRDIYDWAHPTEARPIYDRILAIAEYRDRFSYYFKKFLDEQIQPTELQANIDRLKNMISSSAEQDSLRPMDYGFTYQDFLDSYDQALGQQHVRYGLKPYISERKSSALQQLQVNNISPIIESATDRFPNPEGRIQITAKVRDDNNSLAVQVCYRLDNQATIICEDLFDNGQNGDEVAGDGRYNGSISAPSGVQLINYTITATDPANLKSVFPRCEELVIALNRSEDIPLYINEFMASNDSTIADETGEYDDWIEIYNGGTEAIWLGDKYLSDDPMNPSKWAFPDTSIQQGEFMLLWADEDQEQGPLHTNFRLAKGGEFVGLFDSETTNFALIDGIEYAVQAADTAFGRLPNGTGDFQAMPPTPGASNERFVNIAASIGASFELVAFPNPFSEKLSIRWKNPQKYKLELVIVDLLGRKLYQQTFSPHTNAISWQPQTQNSALYFIFLYKNKRLLGMKKVMYRHK